MNHSATGTTTTSATVSRPQGTVSGSARTPAARTAGGKAWQDISRSSTGFGYGRLGLVARWPNRCTGDSVSPPAMMAHPIVMAAALCLLLAGALMQAMAGHTFALETAGLGLIGVLATERALAGVGAAMRFADPAALAFPLVHLARDLAWVGAGLVWIARRVLRRPHNPEHSMTARAAAG